MRRVIKMDLDGNTIKVYDTIKECAEENNLFASRISQCCNPKIKGDRSGKFRFKYKD